MIRKMLAGMVSTAWRIHCAITADMKAFAFILTGTLVCAFCAAGSVYAEESKNPVQEYIGLYDNDTGNVLVQENEEGTGAKIRVIYYDSSEDYTMWNMSGSLDPSTLILSYTDGVRTNYIWDKEALDYSEEIAYENGEGSFTFSDELKLVWNPASEEPVTDTVYEWFSFSSEEEAQIITEDGVLSIDIPTPQWHEVQDPLHWFVISDGSDLITIEHLQNGQSLPAPSVADKDYEAVYHSYVSTKNEVFVIRGCAVKQKDLEDIMKSIATIKILKFDTKTALTPAASKPMTSYTLKQVNDYYYVTASSLYVRDSYSTDSNILDALDMGNRVYVTAMVQKDGQDTGWAQIRRDNGSTAYVSSKFLAKVNPAEEEKTPEYDEVTLYAKDGSWIKVFRAKGTTGNWKDSHGLEFTEIEGNAHLFYDNTNGVYFSMYKEYWDEINQDEQEKADTQDQPTQAMVLYAENGSEVIVTGHAGDSVWTDMNGAKYHWIAGTDLLYDENNGMQWTYIEGYWANNEPVLDDGESEQTYEYTSSTEEWHTEEIVVNPEESGNVNEDTVQKQGMVLYLDAEGMSQIIVFSSQDPSIWLDGNNRSYKKVKEENGTFVFYDEIDQVFWSNSRTFWDSHTKEELSRQYNLPVWSE